MNEISSCDYIQNPEKLINSLKKKRGTNKTLIMIAIIIVLATFLYVLLVQRSELFIIPLAITMMLGVYHKNTTGDGKIDDTLKKELKCYDIAKLKLLKTKIQKGKSDEKNGAQIIFSPLGNTLSYFAGAFAVYLGIDYSEMSLSVIIFLTVLYLEVNVLYNTLSFYFNNEVFWGEVELELDIYIQERKLFDEENKLTEHEEKKRKLQEELSEEDKQLSIQERKLSIQIKKLTIQEKQLTIQEKERKQRKLWGRRT